jgi:hypothetical protein
MSTKEPTFYIVHNHHQDDERKGVDSYSSVYGLFKNKTDAHLCAIKGIINSNYGNFLEQITSKTLNDIFEKLKEEQKSKKQKIQAEEISLEIKVDAVNEEEDNEEEEEDDDEEFDYNPLIHEDTDDLLDKIGKLDDSTVSAIYVELTSSLEQIEGEYTAKAGYTMYFISEETIQ